MVRRTRRTTVAENVAATPIRNDGKRNRREKNVSRTGMVSCPIRSNQHGIAPQGNVLAEEVIVCGVGGFKVGLLSPIRPVA